MLKKKVSMAFLRLLAAKKTPFGASVINCLTVNSATFPDLPVKVSTLTTLNDGLTTALSNKEDGGRQAEAAYKVALDNWNDAFENDANYVNLIANGDEQTIVNGGYNATKGTRQAAVAPGACKNFHAVAPKAAGIVEVSSDGDNTSRGYVTFATPTEGVTITQTGNQLAITIGGVTAYLLVHTRSKGQFESMPSGKTVALSTFAFNAGGAGPLSNGQQVIPQ